MSTDLRNVPRIEQQITQTRFWGGLERETCIQITQAKWNDFSVPDRFFDSIQLTRQQARAVASELMLFAEGREVVVQNNEDEAVVEELTE